MESFEDTKESDNFLENSFKQFSNSPDSYDHKSSSLLKQQELQNSPDADEIKSSSPKSDCNVDDELDVDTIRSYRRLGNAADLLNLKSELNKEIDKNSTLEESHDEKSGDRKSSLKEGFWKSQRKNTQTESSSLAGNNRLSFRGSIGSEREARVSIHSKSKNKDEDDSAPRRRARGVSTNLKEIPNFSGALYMKFSSDTKWSKYFARILGNCLALYKSILVRWVCVIKFILERKTAHYIQYQFTGAISNI